MIEKKIKTLDGSITVKIPNNLNELTLGQLMDMQEKPDLTDLEVISILAGVTVDDLQNIKDAAELAVFEQAVLSLATQIRYLYNSDDIPQKITFYSHEKPVTVPVMHNLGIEPAGAFLAARNIIAEEINSHIEKYGEEDWQERFNPSLKACSEVLAHYFYCKVTGGRYNEYKIEAFGETIKKLRVTEALPIAKHFFMRYPNLSKPKTSFWHRLLPFWRKKQAFKASRSLNTSIQLTRLPQVI